jgi:hypothetical protein
MPGVATRDDRRREARVRRTLAALGIGAALLLGACGGSGAATPSAAAGGSAQGPAGSAAVPGVGSVIPANDGYETFEVFGLQGAEAVATVPAISPTDLQALLSTGGEPPDDFSYAIGTGSQGTIVNALQIKGLTASSFSQLVPQANTGTAKQEKVGGKDVLASEAAGTGSWVYMKDDMIFVITGTKDGATPLLKQLP